MVAGHIPGQRSVFARTYAPREKVSVPSDITLRLCDSYTRAQWHRNHRGPAVLHSTSVDRVGRGGAMRTTVGRACWWRVGEKSGIAVFTSGRDSSKIEAIPVVATLRMAERSDTFRWMRVLQRYRLRYGTLIHFTLIAKYGTSVSVQKKGGKEI